MKQDAATIIEKLSQWLGQAFPDAREIVIENLQVPSGGFSNETWLLDLVWTRNGVRELKPLVVRLQPRGPGTFPEYDLSLQYRCMSQLAGTDVPVPALLCYCGENSPFEVPFYLMERIDGVAPLENPPYHMEGWLKEMSPAQQGEVWQQCVDTVAAVNRVDWRERGFAFLDRPERGATPLAQMLHYYRNYLGWVEGRRQTTYPVLRKALAWVEAHQPQDEPVALCWGDAKVGNMMFRGTRCVAALDWEMPYLGNPVSDLSWLLMLDTALSTAIGIPRLPGFWERQATVERWCQQTGFSAERLPYYEFLSAFKFAAIMASITTNLVTHGVMPKETDMDVNNPGTAVLAIYTQQYGIDIQP